MRPPENYVMEFATKVSNPFQKENIIHEILASKRIHPRREFFRESIDILRLLFSLAEESESTHFRSTVETEVVNENVTTLSYTTDILKELRAFVRDFMELHDNNVRIQSEELYNAYTDWCNEKVAANNTIMSHVKFGKHIKMLPYVTKRDERTGNFYTITKCEDSDTYLCT